MVSQPVLDFRVGELPVSIYPLYQAKGLADTYQAIRSIIQALHKERIAIVNLVVAIPQPTFVITLQLDRVCSIHHGAKLL